MHREARVDDVLDDDDRAVLDVHVKVVVETDLPGGFHAAIRGHLDVVPVDGTLDLAQDVREEEHRAFHDPDDDRDLVLVFESCGDLAADAPDDGLDLLLRQNDFVSHGGSSSVLL